MRVAGSGKIRVARKCTELLAGVRVSVDGGLRRLGLLLGVRFKGPGVCADKRS